MAVVILGTLDRHVLGLKQLKDRDKVLRLACVNALPLILHRIQQQGKNSKAEQLKAYSKAYEKIRIAKGRQVAITDLTMTGQMLDNFKVIPIAENGYGLGFDNSFANQKAEWNESRYGDLFVPTKPENDVIIKAVQNAIIKILDRL